MVDEELVEEDEDEWTWVEEDALMGRLNFVLVEWRNDEERISGVFRVELPINGIIYPVPIIRHDGEDHGRDERRRNNQDDL
jgi:hypothetical protein